MTFLLTVAFRATKMLGFLRADIIVAFRATYYLEDTMLSINYWSLQGSVQSYFKLGRHYPFCQLSELTTVIFRATKIL